MKYQILLFIVSFIVIAGYIASSTGNELVKGSDIGTLENGSEFNYIMSLSQSLNSDVPILQPIMLIMSLIVIIIIGVSVLEWY